MTEFFATLQNTQAPVKDVREFLRASGRLDLLLHVAQVNAAGRRLARRLAPGLDLAAVDLACTAHDLAGVVPWRRHQAEAEALGLPLSEADRAIPAVLHGRIGAELLRRRLGVTDETILNAVRYHTTLRAGAAWLEQVVFIADKIALDPASRHTGFLPELRAAQATAPLAELCLIYLAWVVREGPGLGWRVHPHVYAAWDELRR